MSETETERGDIAARTREDKLRALVRKDIHPRVTELAERGLERLQDESS